jgi:hypothetical protein
MRSTECSMCRQPATWLIDTEVFGEGHQELIIKAAGVNRFRICRLTEEDLTFQSADRISRTVAVEKEAQNPHGEIA